MASETTIEVGIDKIVGTHSLWVIGLTDDPILRETEIRAPMGWRLFEADSVQVAENIEAHFVAKGMHLDTEGRGAGARFVYIFMGLQARLEGSRSIGRVLS